MCIAPSILTDYIWVVLKQEVVPCCGTYNDDRGYVHRGENEKAQLQEAVP